MLLELSLVSIKYDINFMNLRLSFVQGSNNESHACGGCTSISLSLIENELAVIYTISGENLQIDPECLLHD